MTKNRKNQRRKLVCCPKCGTELQYSFLENGKCYNCKFELDEELKSELSMLKDFYKESIEEITGKALIRLWF